MLSVSAEYLYDSDENISSSIDEWPWEDHPVICEVRIQILICDSHMHPVVLALNIYIQYVYNSEG